MRQKMVVVIIEDRDQIPGPGEVIRENFIQWADQNSQEVNDFVEELSADAANDLLIQSAPPVLTHGSNDIRIENEVVRFKNEYVQIIDS